MAFAEAWSEMFKVRPSVTQPPTSMEQFCVDGQTTPLLMIKERPLIEVNVESI